MICALLLAFSSTAFAAPAFQATAGITYAHSGSGFPPPSFGVGVGVLVPMVERTSWYSEFVTSTSFTKVEPAFLALTGPSFKLTDRFCLGMSVTGRLAPDYEGNLSKSVGVSVVPILPTSFGSLSMPLGISVTPGSGVMETLSFKVAIK